MSLVTRDHLPTILPEGCVGVEVGVCEGAYATTLLRSGRFKRLYGVDTWSESYPGLPPGRDGATMFGDVKALMAQYFGDTWEGVRMESIQASRLFADHSFDLVYVDGDHRYEQVSRDIEAWWPKCKPGGVFAGHDYNDVVGEDVKRAVDEHAVRTGLTFELTVCDWVARVQHEGEPFDARIRSWVFRKPLDWVETKA